MLYHNNSLPSLSFHFLCFLSVFGLEISLLLSFIQVEVGLLKAYATVQSYLYATSQLYPTSTLKISPRLIAGREGT